MPKYQNIREEELKNTPVWIFVDETGTSSFQDKENVCFGLGALVTQNQDKISQIMASQKYQAWDFLSKINKPTFDYFHGKENPHPLKLKVLDNFTNAGNLFGFTFQYMLESGIVEIQPKEKPHL